MIVLVLSVIGFFGSTIGFFGSTVGLTILGSIFTPGFGFLVESLFKLFSTSLKTVIKRV